MIESEAPPTGVPLSDPFPRFQPDAQDVERLIEAARRHPLGLKFLIDGDLGAVAVLFGVHAFAVEAARDRLHGESSHS